MNQEQQLEQALRLTISDLSQQLSNELTTKNVLAIQLTDAKQQIARLIKENEELTKQLDEATKPDEGEK
ncbi:hypothetical protein [Streptococcus plurextorum]|uniref:hypothetical protein n=1 Tax=Streptococcus plurextorum TaxID=456876 RepID=UPI00042A0735|nr:hypothetical protein [Streptococcus plurextorum]